MQTLYTVKGNAPECPSCGNWNAMLDRGEWDDKMDKYIIVYTCRDCGFKVSDPTIKVKD